MNSLFKILIFSSPILAIVFFYVVSMQSKHDVDIKHDEAVFERSWNEAEASFAAGDVKVRYLERANQAEERIKKAEAKRAEAEAKAEKFQAEFEKEIEDFDKKKKTTTTTRR